MDSSKGISIYFRHIDIREIGRCALCEGSLIVKNPDKSTDHPPVINREYYDPFGFLKK